MPFQSAEPVGQRAAAAVARFGTDVTERFSGAVTGEPEDQLRGPFENLFRVLADEAGIPATVLTGELLVAAVSSKPDYGVTVGGLLCGYVELKAPGTGAVTARFTGRNLAQWQRIRELPNLLYTDGNEWALYRDGQIVGQPVRLDGDVTTSGRRLAADARLVGLVELFLKWTAPAPANARALAKSTARLCRLLRGQVLESLEAESHPGWDGARPLTGLMRDWRALLYPEADDQEFADSYAQTVTFALLLARAEGIDLAGTTPSAIAGQLSAHEHALLGRALQVLTDEAVAQQVGIALSTLVRVIGAVNWSGLGEGPEPWRYFYEDFLSVYDSSLRERAGAYYTPAPVVAAQVRLVNGLLQSRLGLTDGLADDTVTVLDPAMGTASYLIETVNLVADEAGRYGEGYVGQAVDALAPRLMGFELMAGSYAVGETLMAAALRRRGGTGRGARLYLTDTLSDPHVEHTQLGGMYAPIADSRRRADRVKREERVVVCLGNPPYDLHASGDTTAGGWVTHPSEGTALWQDFVGSVIGTPAARSLKPVYNLYAYFWRWALWKVFEAHPDQEQAAGVVSFITASSFVSGPGWAGVREHMRRVCDEIWVIDLSREGHQPPVPTRIFPKVQQPVAITMCVRYRDHDPSRPATVRYLPVTGKRAEKFTRLAGLSLDDPAWEVGADDWTGPWSGRSAASGRPCPVSPTCCPGVPRASRATGVGPTPRPARCSACVGADSRPPVARSARNCSKRPATAPLARRSRRCPAPRSRHPRPSRVRSSDRPPPRCASASAASTGSGSSRTPDCSISRGGRSGGRTAPDRCT